MIEIDNDLASKPIEVDGEWKDVGGTRFKLRAPSDGNGDFVRAMLEARSKRIEGQSDSEWMTLILPELLARGVVVGWELKSNGEIIQLDQMVEVFEQHNRLAEKIWVAAIELAAEDSEELEADLDLLGESQDSTPTTETT